MFKFLLLIVISTLALSETSLTKTFPFKDFNLLKTKDELLSLTKEKNLSKFDCSKIAREKKGFRCFIARKGASLNYQMFGDSRFSEIFVFKNKKIYEQVFVSLRKEQMFGSYNLDYLLKTYKPISIKTDKDKELRYAPQKKEVLSDFVKINQDFILKLKQKGYMAVFFKKENEPEKYDFLYFCATGKSNLCSMRVSKIHIK